MISLNSFETVTDLAPTYIDPFFIQVYLESASSILNLSDGNALVGVSTIAGVIVEGEPTRIYSGSRGLKLYLKHPASLYPPAAPLLPVYR